jgi:hypothetical protein
VAFNDLSFFKREVDRIKQDKKFEKKSEICDKSKFKPKENFTKIFLKFVVKEIDKKKIKKRWLEQRNP